MDVENARRAAAGKLEPGYPTCHLAPRSDLAKKRKRRDAGTAPAPRPLLHTQLS